MYLLIFDVIILEVTDPEPVPTISSARNLVWVLVAWKFDVFDENRFSFRLENQKKIFKTEKLPNLNCQNT